MLFEMWIEIEAVDLQDTETRFIIKNGPEETLRGRGSLLNSYRKTWTTKHNLIQEYFAVPAHAHEGILEIEITKLDKRKEHLWGS